MESADFWEALAAIQRRIQALETLVNEVTDEHFDHDQKILVKRQQPSIFVAPSICRQQLGGQPQAIPARKQHHRSDDVWSIARRVRPLRVIPEKPRPSEPLLLSAPAAIKPEEPAIDQPVPQEQ
ncbi:MAG: hypothetical protein ACJ8EF_06030 [Bradyrhizobium sp.]|jgi:hypothetical protein